jgi:DNA polymerase-3 subunit epsilon
MENIPSFVAIDFETACYSKLSTCSLGVALYENGSLTESRSWLLKPIDPGKWTFTNVHGLTDEDCKNQAYIKDIWYELEGYLNNKFVIAHNAIFDMSVLKENLEHFGIEYKNYLYGCTKILSKNYIPYLKDHSLKTVSEFLNIEYGEHDCERDAVNCGEIFLKMVNNTRYPDDLFLGNQLEKKSYLFDTSFLDNFKSTTLANMDGLSVDDVDATATIELFKDKKCLVTGEFDNFSREDIWDKIKSYGGLISSTAHKTIDFFIIGYMPGWVKVDKIKKEKENGRKIIVLDEAELIQVFDKLDSLN